MKRVVVAILAGVINVAAAAPDPQYCNAVASLARKIAEDREKGVSYKAELAMLNASMDDIPSKRALNEMARNMAKVIYVEMPRLTPEGAYKLHYVVCMSQK